MRTGGGKERKIRSTVGEKRYQFVVIAQLSWFSDMFSPSGQSKEGPAERITSARTRGYMQFTPDDAAK